MTSPEIEIEIVSERLSDHYLITPNDLHRGRGAWDGMTPNARTLLSALLSHASGWRIRRTEVDGIMAPLGHDAVSTVIKELRSRRHLTTTRVNAGGGKFGWRWKVTLHPQSISAGGTIGGLTIDGSTIGGSPVDGQPADGSDQGKDGISAGGTIDGSTVDGQPADIRSTCSSEVTEVTTSLSSTGVDDRETSSKPSKPDPRGTRIPDDFSVAPEMVAWAKERVPGLAGQGETEKFVDYWRSIPGAKGRKTDWVATWRNWMRKAAADQAQIPGQRPASSAPPRLTRDEMCPKHWGQDREHCRECRADRLAGDVDGDL